MCVAKKNRGDSAPVHSLSALCVFITLTFSAPLWSSALTHNTFSLRLYFCCSGSLFLLTLRKIIHQSVLKLHTRVVGVTRCSNNENHPNLELELWHKGTLSLSSPWSSHSAWYNYYDIIKLCVCAHVCRSELLHSEYVVYMYWNLIVYRLKAVTCDLAHTHTCAFLLQSFTLVFVLIVSLCLDAKPQMNKNGKRGGAAGGASFFTWFMVLALLGVWTSVAVVYFDLVDYQGVIGESIFISIIIHRLHVYLTGDVLIKPNIVH